MFDVKIVADSISPQSKRLTTLTATYPRFIHSEIMTHRDRARNAASSRAIPWPKMMAAINDDPVIPIRFGSEQKGMQTGGEIERPDLAETVWLEACDNAVRSAQMLADLGVHKSICNRITEPWMWITTLMTATEWNNFYRLRCHPDAEIHFQKIAGMMRDAMAASTPRPVAQGDWHLPFIQDDERHLPLADLKRMSTARSARVSYLTHDGVPNVDKDISLFDRLIGGSGFGHYSPMEHLATPTDNDTSTGCPFHGWTPYRKEFPFENIEG